MYNSTSTNATATTAPSITPILPPSDKPAFQELGQADIEGTPQSPALEDRLMKPPWTPIEYTSTGTWPDNWLEFNSLIQNSQFFISKVYASLNNWTQRNMFRNLSCVLWIQVPWQHSCQFKDIKSWSWYCELSQFTSHIASLLKTVNYHQQSKCFWIFKLCCNMLIH